MRTKLSYVLFFSTDSADARCSIFFPVHTRQDGSVNDIICTSTHVHVCYYVYFFLCTRVHRQFSTGEANGDKRRESRGILTASALVPGMPRMPVQVLLGSWGWGFFAIFLLLLATPSPAAIRRGKSNPAGGRDCGGTPRGQRV